MTEKEIYNCIHAAREWTRNKEEAYKNGTAEYSSYSARDVLGILGLRGEEQNEVLDYLHENGFNYCLDPRFPSKSSEGKEPTPYFACVWGIDQLRSRFDSVYVPYSA